MSPKSVHFELFFICLLILIPWPQTSLRKLKCSRDKSRLVRKIVRSKWTPVFDKYHVQLPLECPLHPYRDLFAPGQNAKKRDRPTQWTCRLCGKSFYQEKFLDKHFANRHASIINNGEDAICLADLCDIMRCEVFQTEESSSLSTGEQNAITDIEVWGDSFRQNSMNSKKDRPYFSVIKQKATESLLTVRDNGRTRQICSNNIVDSHANGDSVNNDKSKVVRCDDKIKSSSSIKSTKTSETLKSTTSIPTDTEGTTTTTTTTTRPTNNKYNKLSSSSKSAKTGTDSKDDAINSTQGDTIVDDCDNKTNSSIPKLRAQCKAEELNKLKSKCEQLIRTCIGGLVLSMQDHTFKELEEEMNKAVCWYLSCDRYWEDGPLEQRPFPWGLMLILILILSLGICFCYYIIWILFESEDTMIIKNGQHNTYIQPYPHYQSYPLHLPHKPNYYYPQQLHVEQPPFENRHSPSHHTSIGNNMISNNSNIGYCETETTPFHHINNSIHTRMQQYHHMAANMVYPPDVALRRDYISRPIPASGLSTSSSGSHLSGTHIIGSNPTTSAIGMTTTTETDRNASMIDSGINRNVPRQYNTHPRQLTANHRFVGGSQQSLRGSTTSHDVMQNEVGQNEHYIYVTYPPDLKKRIIEKYE